MPREVDLRNIERGEVNEFGFRPLGKLYLPTERDRKLYEKHGWLKRPMEKVILLSDAYREMIISWLRQHNPFVRPDDPTELTDEVIESLKNSPVEQELFPDWKGVQRGPE